MTFGQVGEGKSRLANIAALVAMVLLFLVGGLIMSFGGSLIPLGVLLATALLLYGLLVLISRQFLLLRHWGEPLVEIEPDGLRMPWVFAGTLPWRDIERVEAVGRVRRFSDPDPEEGQPELHVVLHLAAGGDYRHQGLPRWRARQFRVPTVDPEALVDAIAGHPGYTGARGTAPAGPQLLPPSNGPWEPRR